MKGSIDVAILAQLMTAQTLLHTLPTSKRVSEFVAQVLEYIPSVQRCAVCICGVHKPSGNLVMECPEFCSEHSTDRESAPLNLCTPKNGEEVISLPLAKGPLRFGQILIVTDHMEKFERVRPFLLNFASLTTIIIENMWSEERLVRQQTFMETILDTMDNGIVVCDERGILSKFNRATRLLHGIGDENLPPEEWADRYDLYQADGTTPMVTEEVPLFRAYQGEYLKNVEIVISPKGGSKHSLLVSGREMRDKNGKKLGAVVSMNDITELKRAQETLKKSNEELLKHKEELEDQVMARTSDLRRANDELSKFGHMVSSSRDMQALIDPAYIYLAANAAYLAAFEKKSEEMVGHSVVKILGEALFDSVVKPHAEICLTGEDVRFQDWFAYPGTGRKYMDVLYSPYTGGEGEVLGFLVTIRDITDIREGEVRLQNLQNYLSSIIDSMPSMMVGVDVACTVTQWNKRAEELTGIAASAAHGEKLADVFPPMASDMEKIAESIQARKIVHQQKRADLTTSGTSYEEVTIYPLMSNGVEGAVIRIDDVTQKVKMEEMMIQSEKMLSLGGLAAGMAHEINNPLAAIMQTANIMATRLGKAGEIPANIKAAEEAGTSMEAIKNFMEKREIPRMLATISESGRRVVGVVNNMLSFARKSNSGALPHQISNILNKTLELAESDYDFKNRHDFKLIEIKREYAGGLPPVLCDEGQIQQVFLNIFRNSAQEMATGQTIKPRIILRTRLEGGEAIRIEMEDNGPGMTEEIRKRIFEPFFTTKPEGTGTGLGLSVSYFIITENHGGVMTVESRPGECAKFIITLPLRGKN